MSQATTRRASRSAVLATASLGALLLTLVAAGGPFPTATTSVHSRALAAASRLSTGTKGTPAHVSASAPLRAQRCPNVGVYVTPPSPLPLRPATSVRAFPYSGSRGQIMLATYTGCGGATTGAFTVTVAFPYPVVKTQSQSAAFLSQRTPAMVNRPPVPGSPSICGDSYLYARGTFHQDPRHRGDALYVLVAGTVVRRAVGGPMEGQPRSGTSGPGAAPSVPCPLPRTGAIQEDMAFHDVTGFLSWSAGAPLRLRLLFLPPPPGAPESASDFGPLSIVALYRAASTTGSTPTPSAPATAVGRGGATAVPASTIVIGTAMAGGTAMATATPGPTGTTVPAGGTVVLHVPPTSGTVTVSVGTRIVVDVRSRGYALDRLTYDTSLLTANGRRGDGSPILRAISAGTTTITGAASPRCRQSRPPCEIPSFALSYTIIVKPVGSS